VKTFLFFLLSEEEEEETIISISKNASCYIEEITHIFLYKKKKQQKQFKQEKIDTLFATLCKMFAQDHQQIKSLCLTA
jgi:hypothetical protein